MINLYYVGFNAYQQCPHETAVILPKVIENWTKFTLKEDAEIKITFNHVIIRTEKNFIIYGLVNKNCNCSQLLINCPVQPQSFIGTDEFLFISSGIRIFKISYQDKEWEEIPVLKEENNHSWKDKEIVQMSFMFHNQELVLLLNDGSVWNMHDKMLYNIFTASLEKAIYITSGLEHALILTESGCVLSFGVGSRGQLGHGSVDSSHEALQIFALGGLNIKKIATGAWHSCALTDCGDLYMWGWNNYGQMTLLKESDGTDEQDGFGILTIPTKVNVDSVHRVKDIACGMRHTIIMTGNGELLGTGWNEYKQLGIQDCNLKRASKFLKLSINCKEGKIICGPWSTLICGN